MRTTLTLSAILLSTTAAPSVTAQTSLQSAAPVGTAPASLPTPDAQPVAPGPVTPSAPSTGPASATTPSDPSTSPGLGEIVVTANKRAENINKVGLSITAISGAALAERKITTIGDVAAAVPGLSFAPSQMGSPILTLRGIGFNEASLGVYPAVSLYVDQIPLPFPVMTSHAAFDLERIEVLKGPQGTLFGENSTGGAINYIAAKPTDHFVAGADLTYGRFNEIEGSAYISGPLSDTLGFRVAATGHHMDDWQYSTSRRDTNGHQSYFAGRGILDWKPSSSARFSLNINGWRDTSQPQALQLIAVRPQAPQYEPEQYGTIAFSPNKPRAADWTNEQFDPSTGVVDPQTGAVQPGTSKLVDFDPSGNERFFQAGLRGDIDITDGITLTTLTSYDVYKQNQVIDSDGSPGLLLNLQHDNGKIHSLNQEVRLANAASSRFRWIVGGNYEHSNTEEYQLDRQAGTTAYNPGNLYLNASGVTVQQHIRNYAGFANGEFSLTHQLTIKGGVRYTQSNNHANICSTTIPGGNVDTLFNLLGSLLGTVPFTPIGPSDCYTLNQNNVPGQPFIKSLNQHNVSWRGGIDYQVTPTTLLYVNASRGYKAGSFPTLAAALFAGLQPVTQESVTAYEGGVKTQLFDRRVTLSAATFYYDYKDKQVRGKLADPIFGDLDALVNIPKSRVFGVEGEVTIRPAEGLTLNGAVTYLDSKIQRYTGVNIVGQPDYNAAGSPLPFTPKWSGVVNVDYRMKTDRGTPFVGFTVNARTSADAAIAAERVDYADAPNTFVKPGVSCVYCIKGYATVDVRVGFEADGGRWSVSAFGKNIFNKYYWTNVISSYEAAARAAGMPATYGVTFGVKFN
jgi:outer membrane receptor protein involved in Fe transport